MKYREYTGNQITDNIFEESVEVLKIVVLAQNNHNNTKQMLSETVRILEDDTKRKEHKI